MASELARVLVSVLVFAVVAGLIVGLAVLLGATVVPSVPTDDTEPRAYDIDELYIDRVGAQGVVDVDVEDPGVVLIDQAHDNALDEGDLRILTKAMTAAGNEVRVAHSTTTFDEELEEADALVIIDPQARYAADRSAAVAEFVDGDGQLLLVGQPARAEVVGFEMQTRESEADSVANRLGFSFGTDYVYDMEANDGNHRNVLVEGTDVGLMDDVNEAYVYTTSYVTAADAEPLLVTGDTAQRSQDQNAQQYTIAAATESVMAIGDATFLTGERYNIADNEELIAAIVTFLSDGP